MPEPSTSSGTVPAGRASRQWSCAIGLIILAVVLILIGVLARTWLAPDDTSYQRDTDLSSAEGSEGGGDEGAEEQASPAPDDAKDLTAIVSPSGNIHCTLEGSVVGCSIDDRDYGSDLEDCEEGTFDIRAEGEEVGPACDEDFEDPDVEELDYGESTASGEVACTSEDDGMTCWDVRSGKGFTVSRDGYEVF